MDDEGRTTAKRLYEFLELNPAVYSRWCKMNILDNAFAEKNLDYEVLNMDVENPQGGRPTTDYALTASFAKKLAMGCQNARGEQARDYFIKVEDSMKKVVQKAPKIASELEKAKVEAQKARAEAMLLNAKNRTFQTLMNTIKDKELSPIAIQVFGLKGLEGVFGVEVGNSLPKCKRTYSATEIGHKLGISANKVGSLCIQNNLKTEQYGVWNGQVKV